jgi:hypothetical protein
LAQCHTSTRVSGHASRDLEMNLPDGRFAGAETGMVVIAINLPMLMVQYRAFRKAEGWFPGQVDDKSAMMFVHMYALPNMLFSQLDQTLFNRNRRLQVGIPPGWSISKYPFSLTGSENRPDVATWKF